MVRFLRLKERTFSKLSATGVTRLLAFVVLIALTHVVDAQPNSLRQTSDSDAYLNQHSQSRRSTAPNLVEPRYANAGFQPRPERDAYTQPIGTFQENRTNGAYNEPDIRLTNFQPSNPTSAGANQAAAQPSNMPRSSLAATANGLPWRDPNKILDLVMKISLNLVFVLSFAFGAILLAKRWMLPNSGAKPGDRLDVDSLSVLQTLRLDQRISVRLVQWRSNRFLIACDQNGIQSVNALNESFDQTLTELESEDQLVAKLLASLEASKS